MKCNELKPLVFSLKDLAYIDEPMATKNFGNPHDHAVYKATEVDSAIAELKQKLSEKDAEIERLNNALDKERSETIKYMDELCNAKNEIERLTIDKRNNELRADVADATIEKLKAEIAGLKQKLEDVQASAYKESVDAGMRERRLRRALWIARANSADGQFIYWCARFAQESGFTKADIRGYSVNTKRRLRTNGEWIETWKNVKIKCLKKAEEYK